MSGLTAKSEVLSVRMPITTIVGCYDIHDLMGEPTINKAMSSVITDALTALIDTMRTEGKLPQYPDQEALLLRLRELLAEDQRRPVSTPTITAPEELPNDTGVKFVELADAVAMSVAKDPIADGDVDVGDLTSPDEPRLVTLSFSDLEAANPKDRLIAYCKGDKLREQALVEVYSNIPRERFGSEMAAQLLASTLELLQAQTSAPVQQEE